jgi:hypothetical protein
MDDADQPIDLVTTVGPELDRVVQTLRDVLHHSGALRVVAAVDGEPPAVVDVGRLQPVEVQTEKRIVHLPHAIELEVEPLPLTTPLRQLPPFDVDPEQGEVIGTIGGLDMLADAMRELAGALGGRSVAIAQYPTTTPNLTLAISARVGEPVLVTIGDEEFELPE